MDLVPFIYHEKQDRDGSMLCAQHCLNNLLQQGLYSPGDLADLAADLDQQENAELSTAQQSRDSNNADGTGFFSLAVLENALRVFDLELVRWRSEEMKPYHDKPEEQSAFIMNLSQHWLPLRRFAGRSDRWYNLNSLLVSPEWLSSEYLSLAINTAEDEGHSVFVVRSKDAQEQEQGISALPECQADLMGLQLGSPSAGGHAGFSDDVVSTSTQRSQAEFERFQREQMQAFQEQQYNSGGLRNRGGAGGPQEGTYASAAQTQTPATLNRFQRTRMEEEEDLRKAIEASLAESGAGSTSGAEAENQAGRRDDDDDDDDKP